MRISVSAGISALLLLGALHGTGVWAIAVPESVLQPGLFFEPSPDDPVCRAPGSSEQTRIDSNPRGVVSVTEISPPRPSYFARPVPGSNPIQMGVTGFCAGGEGCNRLIDLSTGTAKSVPGSIDPVATPDGRYLTTPLMTGMGFYDLGAGSEVQKGPLSTLLTDQSQVISGGLDSGLTGVYQSVGVLNHKKAASSYRVLTDEGIRDYRIEHGRNGSEPKVTPIGETRVVCPDIPAERRQLMALPMLSKDGTRVSFLDSSQDPPVTMIYTFDPENGNCLNSKKGFEPISLGVATGKVDFSFNDRDEIVFAKRKTELLDNDSSYFAWPSEYFASNVYSLNLRSGKVRKLSDNLNGNAVYPSWLPDGKVVYLEHPADWEKPSRFVVVDPKPRSKGNWDVLTGECLKESQVMDSAAKVLLGNLWMHLCEAEYGGVAGLSASALATLSLDPQACQAMVREYWAHFSKTWLKQPTPVLSELASRSPELQKQLEEILKQTTVGDDHPLLAACPRSRLMWPRRSDIEQVHLPAAGGVSAQAEIQVLNQTVAPPAIRSDEQVLAALADQGITQPKSLDRCVSCHQSNDAYPWNELVKLAKHRTGPGEIPLVDSAYCQIQGGTMPRGAPLEPAEKQAYQSYFESLIRSTGRTPPECGTSP